MPTSNQKKGYTLVEVLVSIAILIILLASFFGVMVVATRSFAHLKTVRDLNAAATISMERITREIRLSSSINAVESVLNNESGRLRLMTVEDGTIQDIDIKLEGGRVLLSKRGVELGSLTAGNVQVTRLIFHHIPSEIAGAVKIEMTIEAGQGETARSETYYSTVVLRGSY
jgi:prepilin-type N-terminal cleavage/methylation domain-containing protein